MSKWTPRQCECPGDKPLNECQCCSHSAQWGWDREKHCGGGSNCFFKKLSLHHRALYELLMQSISVVSVGMAATVDLDVAKLEHNYKKVGIPRRHWEAIEELLLVMLDVQQRSQNQAVVLDDHELALLTRMD